MEKQQKDIKNPEEYEIIPYSSEHLLQVARLMSPLWGDDIELNLKHFKWKHIDNPYLEHPLAIVALHEGKVVGSRAYFALKFRVGERNDFILLIPGDTVVHPKHQRKGLSVAMGKKAEEEYRSKYKVFLNFTSSPASLPGYLRLGFFPLAPKNLLTVFSKRKGLEDWMPTKAKNYLKKHKSRGFIQLLSRLRKILTSKKEMTLFGEFGNIIISDSPKPEDMVDVITKQNQKNQKIKLWQDEEFFQWRYLNPMGKYIFYYYRPDHSVTGYLVIRISPQNILRGHILDYAQSDNDTLEKILRYITESGYPENLFIPSYGLEENLLQTLKRLNLHERILTQKKKEHVSSEHQLLVRPIKENLVENDWFIDGLDIRNFENWEIKPICSDGD